MSKMFGTKNLIERSDARRTRKAIIEVCRTISGSQVTARQIADMMERPIHPARVNAWLRRLSNEGVIEVRGTPFSKHGRVTKVIQ